jgi:hypothetical protein
MTLVCRNKECVEILLERKIFVIQHTGPFLVPEWDKENQLCVVFYKKCPRSVKVKRRCNSVMGSVLISVTDCCH